MLALLLGASVLYSLFYPTPYLRQVLRDEPVLVVDRDHTPMSRRFARWLDASEGVAVTGRTADLEAAQAAVRAGTAGGVVLIPQDFERHMLRREPATVTTYADGSYLLVRARWPRPSIRSRQLRCGYHAAAPAGTPGELAAVQSARRIRHLPRACRLHPGAAADAAHRDGHAARGSSGTAAARPGPVWATLGGTVTVLLVLYLLQAAFMFLVAFRLYGLPLRADLATAAVFLIPFIAANTLLGLAIGELFERPESATVALVLTSVPALFLSGISFPVENQAAWVRAIALALPTTFGIRGFVQIGEMGATLAEAWKSWGALWVQTLVYGLRRLIS